MIYVISSKLDLEVFMSLTKVFHKNTVALSALSLLFVISCGKDNSTSDNIYAETVADCT